MLQQMPRPALRVLLLSLATALPLAAQSGARVTIPVTPVLLSPAEEERISCRRQRADEQLDARYPGRGLFDFALEGSRPLRWHVVLLDSRRSVTLALQRNYVPRAVLVEAGRDARVAGQHESLQLRFLPDGAVQTAEHVVTPRRGAPMRAPMDSAEARAVYELARELAFRCDRNIVEPVPVGSIQRQIPPA